MSTPATPTASRLLSGDPGLRRRRAVNRAMEALATLAALAAVIVLAIVIASVFIKGVGAINLNFFVHSEVPFGQTGGGIANAIVGTVILVALASAMAIPVGILIGIHTAEFARPRTAAAVRFVLDILNGVPTIVTGIFVFGLLVIGNQQSGYAGAFALAIIMLPIVARAAQEVLALVPTTLKEGSLALGATRWRTLVRVVLPTAASGLITAALLAVARVAGETAPLLFTAMNNRYPSAAIDRPIASLPVQILTYATSPYKDWQDQAWTGALVLVAIVVILNLSARVAASRRSEIAGQGR